MMNRGEDSSLTTGSPFFGSQGQLCLYIAGPSPRAEQAEANVRRCCAQHFAGRYELEVVDLCQHPERASHEQLLALPALVRREPAPTQYLVGTLTNEPMLLNSLAFGPDC